MKKEAILSIANICLIAFNICVLKGLLKKPDEEPGIFLDGKDITRQKGRNIRIG